MPAALNLDLSPAGDVTECDFMSITGLWNKVDSLEAGSSTVPRCGTALSQFCSSRCEDRIECATTENYRYDFTEHCTAQSDAHQKPFNVIRDVSIESVKRLVNLTSCGVDGDSKSSGETESCSSGFENLSSGLLASHEVTVEESAMANGLNAAIEQLSVKVMRSESEGTGDSGCVDYASDSADDFDECGLVIDTIDFDEDDFTKADNSNVENKHCAGSETVESSLCNEGFKHEQNITLNEVNDDVITSDSAVSVSSDLSCDGSLLVKTESLQEMCGDKTLTEIPPIIGGRCQSVLESVIESPDMKAEDHKNKLMKHRSSHENFISNRMLAEWPLIAKCRVGAGLQNLGNTCFVNATIQCLTYTLPLVNYLFTFGDSASCAVSEMCLMCELEQHMKQCFENGGTIVKPHSILQKLKVIARHMRWGRQEDAHEFLRYMVEAMHKSCISGHQPLPENTKDVSVVNEIFGGILRSQVTCMKCSAKSNTYDPFLDISLDVKNVSTILRALERFVEPETLDTDNAYNCTKCHCKVRAQKRFTIHRLPHVLTIQLKRYGITGGKVTRHITFPEVLDVRPFVSTGQDHSRSGNDEKLMADFKYRLYGVLVHEGHSTSSGHYYCYVSTSSGGWYCMNDHMVRRSSLNQVLNAEAYLLFYKRGLVSTSSSSHGHSASETFMNDIQHMSRCVPARLCRSMDGASQLRDSASSTDEWCKSLSPERKACLGGQQMMSGETLKNQRMQSPRLACRGGQMMINSLKSTSAASRPIRKPQAPLNVNNRKNMARYRRAIRKSCRERNKILDSACSESHLGHSKMESNHDVDEKESSTAESNVAAIATPMPRIVLKIRQGRIVDSTLKDVGSGIDQTVSKDSMSEVSEQVLCSSKDSLLVESSKELSTASDLCVVNKNADCTKELPLTTGSVRSVGASNIGSAKLKQPNCAASYDKLSQDYFIKLSQMCATAHLGNSLKVSSASHELKKPSVIEKPPKSLSVSKLNRHVIGGNTFRSQSRSKHCTSAERSSTNYLQVSRPTDDSCNASKVGTDTAKPVQQLRGDIYDFDVGDETDSGCPSLTLASHRQNSTNSDKDGLPGATTKIPGAYGLLTKTKRMFSSRSHAVINACDSIDTTPLCSNKAQTEGQKHLSKQLCSLKKNRCKTSMKQYAATGIKTNLNLLYSPAAESIRSKKSSSATSGTEGVNISECQKQNSGVQENGCVISENSMQLWCSKRKFAISEEEPTTDIIEIPGKLKKSNYGESVSSNHSESSPVLGVPCHQELPHLPDELLSQHSFVHAPVQSPTSLSLSNQQLVKSTKKESEPTVGPIRLKICRVSDAHPTSKIYNVVVPSKESDQPALSSMPYVGDPLKRRTFSQKDAETSGPGRGS